MKRSLEEEAAIVAFMETLLDGYLRNLTYQEEKAMRRTYFSPDIETTHKIADELRAEGIEDRHMHVLAKRDTPLQDLP
jgi:hypothetical protein